MHLSSRPRRNRKTPVLREIVAETHLKIEQLVYPVFITDGSKIKDSINSMPGQFRYSIDELLPRISYWIDQGIQSFALFPKIQEPKKNSKASEALNPNCYLISAIEQIKNRYPNCTLITDIALDPFSSDGHDGLVKSGKILNDETVEILAKMSVLHAQAGADVVAPSDMMDGRVRAIRHALDEAGYVETSILSYSAKYASAFYGPFRDALDSAPKSGDKKTYQMDYRNKREAIREVLLDVKEGADLVMIKPALSYLDVISEVRSKTNLPVAAYNVSGEYAMIKAAAAAGMLNETQAMLEVLTSIKRAGADMILTYFAPAFAAFVNQKDENLNS